MDILPPAVVRTPGLHFDQTLAQPIQGPPRFRYPDKKPPDHLQQILGQTPIFNRA
jgi:hypothetical protein